MAKLITESRLKEEIQKENGFIINGKIQNAEGIKYDLRMSNKLLKSSYLRPIDISELPQEKKIELCIEPGEVVFVLSEEILNLPNNIKATLSPKRKLSHEGILVMGGFGIDPLYKGRLLVGLYNFSSSPFPIIPDRKLIAAMFYKLSEQEIDDFQEPTNPINDFPEELIKLIKNYDPISTQKLNSDFINLKIDFEKLKEEFRDRENWYKRLEKSIDKNVSTIKGNSESIDKLIRAIDDERLEFKDAERDLINKMYELNAKAEEDIRKFSNGAYKLAGIVGVISAIAVSLFTIGLKYFLTH